MLKARSNRDAVVADYFMMMQHEAGGTGYQSDKSAGSVKHTQGCRD
jgi:hypothetical protein